MPWWERFDYVVCKWQRLGGFCHRASELSFKVISLYTGLPVTPTLVEWGTLYKDFYCIVSYRIVSYRIVSYRIVSYRIVSYRIVSYRIVSYRIVSYRIVSYRIVSYRIVSYRIVKIVIVLCRVWLITDDFFFSMIFSH